MNYPRSPNERRNSKSPKDNLDIMKSSGIVLKGKKHFDSNVKTDQSASRGFCWISIELLYSLFISR